MIDAKLLDFLTRKVDTEYGFILNTAQRKIMVEYAASHISTENFVHESFHSAPFTPESLPTEAEQPSTLKLSMDVLAEILPKLKSETKVMVMRGPTVHFEDRFLEAKTYQHSVKENISLLGQNELEQVIKESLAKDLIEKLKNATLFAPYLIVASITTVSEGKSWPWLYTRTRMAVLVKEREESSVINFENKWFVESLIEEAEKIYTTSKDNTLKNAYSHLIMSLDHLNGAQTRAGVYNNGKTIQSIGGKDVTDKSSSKGPGPFESGDLGNSSLQWVAD